MLAIRNRHCGTYNVAYVASSDGISLQTRMGNVPRASSLVALRRKFGTRMAGLFLLALAFGCAESSKNDVSGLRGPRFDFRDGSEFTVIVNSRISVYPHKGDSVSMRMSRRTSATMKNGAANPFARAQKPVGGPKGVPFRPQVSVPRTTVKGDLILVMDDPPDLTPILAVQDGTYDDSFDETGTDDSGNVVEAIGTTGSYGTPITDIRTYLNGSLAATWHFNWIPVDGGYVLRYQTLTGYNSGAPVGNIFTEIEWPILYAQSGPHSRVNTAALFATMSVKKVGCWLAPSEAFAYTSCVNEKIGFARDTFLHVGATIAFVGVFSDPVTGAAIVVTPGAAALAIGMWAASWHAWTSSMHAMLVCIRPQRT